MAHAFGENSLRKALSENIISIDKRNGNQILVAVEGPKGLVWRDFLEMLAEAERRSRG